MVDILIHKIINFPIKNSYFNRNVILENSLHLGAPPPPFLSVWSYLFIFHFWFLFKHFFYFKTLLLRFIYLAG